jgi:hypothetical protein
MRTCLRPFISFVVIVSLSPALPAADGKGPANQKNKNQRKESPQEKARELAQKQREEAERLRKAANDLAKQEQAAFAAANQEIAEARTAHRVSSKSLAEAKTKASAEFEKSLGLEKALAEMNQTQKAFDQTAEPVLKSVREGAEYKTAKDKADRAEAAIKATKEDDTRSDAEKRARTAELFPATLAASDLEKKALKDHPGASAAAEKLEAARRRVSDLRAKVEEKVEKDPAVRAARESVEKTAAGMQNAEARLATVKAQAAAAEKRLQAGIIPRDRDDKSKNDKGSPKKD